MRRYTFYFLVFVLTSCAGLTAAILLRPERIVIQNPETTVTTSLPSAPLKTDSMPEKTEGFECRNKLFSFMLDEVRRRERSEKENLNERIDDYINRSGVTNCEEIFRIDWRPDLNRDGRREVIVTSGGHLWATARSDEWTWVVQETRKGYKVILDAGFVAGIELGRKKYRGYTVLASERHNGGAGFLVGTYIYQKGAYRLSKCMSYRWNEDGDEEELSSCRLS